MKERYFMLKNILKISALAVLASGCASTQCDKTFDCASAPKYDVAAYIWPAYQNEPRWKELGIFGDGKGEWQNVYEAKPKHEGHQQPIVPLWGYEMEDDPIAVARKIDASLAAGVNVWIYDWYWYEGKPFLENALNNGFLKAPNNERIKFYIMWANHDVTNLWNNKASKEDKDKVIWNADVSFDEFKEKLVPRFIEYFKKPNYYKIDGKPLFSIYQISVFARGLGGYEGVKKAFDYLDAEAKKAGFKGVHFMWNNPVNKWVLGKDPKLPNNPNPTPEEVMNYLGFDSHTTYNWCSESWGEFNKAKPELTYAQYAKLSVGKYDLIQSRFKKGQYFPHVSLAWDNNPRYIEYRAKVEPASPEEFEKALRAAKKWIDENRKDGMPRLITVNAWNEWTEGCYLEPDKKNGYGYLNALARVFGGAGQAKE